MSELAADGIPVAVTCRVLNIARQYYYRWRARPVTAAELERAYRANALFDAHRDDPEFGYRFLADEARDAGLSMADRTAWRICSSMGWWSAFGRKRRRNGKKAGPPVHDDLVRRDFTATAPNQLWLADITEHHTTEGKLYLCAVKDACSNRIVGYSIDSRMKSRLAVAAVRNAVARRHAAGAVVDGCIVHSDRGVAVPVAQVRPRPEPPPLGRLDGPRRCGRRQRRDGVLLRAPAEERPQPTNLGHPRRAPDRDRDLDRTDLPPTPQTRRPRPIDPHRVRDHHDHAGHSGRVTQPVT
ncbi:MAG: putative transposase [Mycobacterium sp.]|nr:putative transposase [Mycobacterium sp.]